MASPDIDIEDSSGNTRQESPPLLSMTSSRDKKLASKSKLAFSIDKIIESHSERRLVQSDEDEIDEDEHQYRTRSSSFRQNAYERCSPPNSDNFYHSQQMTLTESLLQRDLPQSMANLIGPSIYSNFPGQASTHIYSTPTTSPSAINNMLYEAAFRRFMANSAAQSETAELDQVRLCNALMASQDPSLLRRMSLTANYQQALMKSNTALFPFGVNYASVASLSNFSHPRETTAAFGSSLLDAPSHSRSSNNSSQHSLMKVLKPKPMFMPSKQHNNNAVTNNLDQSTNKHKLSATSHSGNLESHLYKDLSKEVDHAKDTSFGDSLEDEQDHIERNSVDNEATSSCSSKREVAVSSGQSMIEENASAAATAAGKQKIFTCQECGKVFNAHYNLTRHMPVHTGARPFVCKVCGKGFRQVSSR